MNDVVTTPSNTAARGTLVILPVLNEIDHVERLVEAIIDRLRDEPHTVCLVDDGSTDGTLEKIGQLQQRHAGRIHLIQRTKEGRGSQRGGALLAGLEWGLAHTSHDVFVEMDGDLSHRPEELQTGIDYVRSDQCDIAIASKYQLGSKVTNRPLGRRILSRTCNFLIGLLIDSKIEDYSNGYRFYSRSAAQLIADSTIHNTSPIYLSEVLAIWLNAGKRVAEFPSQYIGRNEGLSKLRLVDLAKALGVVPAIAMRYHVFGFGHKEPTETALDMQGKIVHRHHNRIVLAFGIFMVMLMAQLCFFMPRPSCFDEMGLWNISYMHQHHGKMTYPAHWHFDDPVVHPPTQYWIASLLMKLGIETHVAFYIPLFFLFVVTMLLIYASPFPDIVKIAIPFGIYVAFFLNYAAAVSLRPDASLMVAWIGGLVALESARLENWNTRKLLLGSALITFASILHYPATFAFLGVFVYSTWIVRKIGWRPSLGKLSSIALGGCLVGIPYLVFFVVPYWNEIHGMTRIAGFNMGEAWARHVELYGQLAARSEQALGAISYILHPVWKLGVPIPLFLWLVLLIPRYSRGIALASAPLLLFMLFYTPRKWGYYLYPETALFLATFVSLIGLSFAWIIKRLPRVWHTLSLSCGVCLLVFTTLYANDCLSDMDIRPVARRHNMHIVRACNRELLGENAVVGSRTASWYMSGGDHWRLIDADILWKQNEDIDGYFRLFDAFVETAGFAGSTHNDDRDTFATWYLKKQLALKGFYIKAEDKQNQSCLMFASPSKSTRVSGFLQWNSEHVWRFDQLPNGNHTIITFSAPVTWQPNVTGLVPRPLYIPLPNPGTAPGSIEQMNNRLVVMLIASNQCDELIATLPQGTQVRDKISGSIERLDADALYAKLKREDQPIQFYRSEEHLKTALKLDKTTSVADSKNENGDRTLRK